MSSLNVGRRGGVRAALAGWLALAGGSAWAQTTTPPAPITGPSVSLAGPYTGGGGLNLARTNDGTTGGPKGGAAFTVSFTAPGSHTLSVGGLAVRDYTTNITFNGGGAAAPATGSSNMFAPAQIYGARVTGFAEGSVQSFANVDITGNAGNLLVVDAAGYVSAFGGGARLANLPNLAYNGGTIGHNALTLTVDTATAGAGGAHADTGLGVHANGGGLVVETEWTAQAAFSGLVFENNAVTVTGPDLGAGTAARGGALYLSSTNDEEKVASWVDGTLNKGLDATVANTLFTGNRAQNDAADGLAAGGAVAMSIAAKATFTNTRFAGNTATSNTDAFGGAVFVNLRGSLGGGTLYEGSLDAYADGAYVRFVNAAFTGNQAVSAGTTALGGAIYTDHDILVTNSTFQGNTVTNSATTTANAIHLANADVTFAETAATSVSTDHDGITGVGDIVKTGAGRLNLYGLYNDLTGDLDLRQGVTAVKQTSAVTGNLNMDAGAVLTFADADAGARLTVTDAQLAGATVIAAVGAGNLLAGVDTTDATLDADTKFRLAGDVQVGTYTGLLASANAITQGGYAGETVNGALMRYTVAVNGGNSVDATVTDVKTIAAVAATGNQRGIAGAIQAFGPGHRLYDEAYRLGQEGGTEGAIRSVLDHSVNIAAVDAVGGALAAARPIDWIGSVVETNFHRFDDPGAPGLADASAGRLASDGAFANPYFAGRANARVWLSVDGFNHRSRRTDDAARAQTTGYGFTLGFDKRFGDWLAGGAFRYGDHRMKVDGRDARTDFDSYSLALYGGRRFGLAPGTLHVVGGLHGALHDMESRRDLFLAGAGHRYTSDYDAYTYGLFVDAGLNMRPNPCIALQPFVNLAWDGYRAGSYKEKGGPADARLRVGKIGQHNLTSLLGLRAAGQLGARFALDGQVAWRHVFGGLRPDAKMRFVDPASNSFTVVGTPLVRDQGVAGVGATFQATPAFDVRAGYDFTFAGGARSHQGRLTFGFRF